MFQIGSRPKTPAVLTAAHRASGGSPCPIGHIRRALWRCKRCRSAEVRPERPRRGRVRSSDDHRDGVIGTVEATPGGRRRGARRERHPCPKQLIRGRDHLVTDRGGRPRSRCAAAGKWPDSGRVRGADGCTGLGLVQARRDAAEHVVNGSLSRSKKVLGPSTGFRGRRPCAHGRGGKICRVSLASAATFAGCSPERLRIVHHSRRGGMRRPRRVASR